MAYRRGRKRSITQAIQHGLVGDLARQADVTRRNLVALRLIGRSANARVCPVMRRRPGPRGGADIGGGLARSPTRPSNRRREGARDIDGAIAADVIEGRRTGRACLPSGLDRAGQGRQGWPTILGTPVVPEVNGSHSVAISMSGLVRERGRKIAGDT